MAFSTLAMSATRTCWSRRRDGGRLMRFLDVRVSSSPRVVWRPLLEGSGLLIRPRLLLLRSIVAVEFLERLEAFLLELLIRPCPGWLGFDAKSSVRNERLFARGVRGCVGRTSKGDSRSTSTS